MNEYENTVPEMTSPVYCTYDPEKDTYIRTENPEEAEFAIISIQKLNGYEKSLRIIRDRSLLQINKSVADENGYTLIQSAYRYYSHGDDFKFYQIKKNTPYGLNIPLQTVKMLVMDDLRKYYNYVELPTLKYTIKSGQPMTLRVTPKILAKRIPFLDHNSSGADEKVLYSWRQSVPDVISFDFSVISGNYGQGVYAVTYWATDLI